MNVSIILVLVGTVVGAKHPVRRFHRQPAIHRSKPYSEELAKLLNHIFKLKHCRRMRWNPLF